MRNDDKIRETEKLLADLKAQKEESAATIAESPPRRKAWKIPRAKFKLRYKYMLFLAIIALLLIAALPFAAFWVLKGSTFTENKSVFVERVQSLNELTTAQAFTKVILEEQDNTLFGKEIGLDLPGTKRKILLIVPGSVKAGVDFSQVTESDIEVNEKEQTAKLILPKPQFLGTPEIFFDQVKVHSFEGLFREKADIEKAYELAQKAQKMMMEEATGQGLLEMAEENAEKSVKDMFQLVDYDVQVEFKE